MELWINVRGEVQEWPLPLGQTDIGRDEANSLCLDDPDISARHCRIEFAEGESPQIHDLKSSNGTFVNGIQIDRAAIDVGDTIQIGGTLLVVSDNQTPSRRNAGRPFYGLEGDSLAAFKPSSRSHRRPRARLKEHGGSKDRTRNLLSMRLQQLILVSQRLAAEPNLPKLLDTMLSAIIDFAGADRAMVVLREGRRFRFALGLNMDERALQGEDRGFYDALFDRTCQTRDLVMGDRQTKSENGGGGRRSNRTAKLELCHVVCLPLLTPQRGRLRYRGERRRDRGANAHIYGLIYLDKARELMILDSADRQFIKAIAAQATIALQNAQLYHQATMEPLTGLLNRDSFKRLLSRELAVARRDGGELGLIMVDLDHFKAINDQHGHQAGDAVLKAVADRLVKRLRRSDLIGRYGGEEFIIALPGNDPATTKIVAEALRQIVGGEAIGGTEVTVTASLGYAVFPAHAQTTGLLVKRADQALYEAKHRGRNQIVPWTPELDRIGRQNDPLAGLISGDVMRDHRNLGLFFEIARGLAADPSDVGLGDALERILQVLRAVRIRLFLGPELDTDSPLIERRREAAAAYGDPELIESYLLQALSERRSIYSDKLELLTGAYSLDGPEPEPAPGGPSILCLPFLGPDDKGLGAISIEFTEKDHGLSSSDLAFFEALAGQIALVLKARRS